MTYKIGEIFKDEYTHEWIQCVERSGEACSCPGSHKKSRPSSVIFIEKGNYLKYIDENE